MEDLELAHVQWFHQTYYSPANAVIAIVSPRAKEQVMALVQRYLAHVRGGQAPTRETIARISRGD